MEIKYKQNKAKTTWARIRYFLAMVKSRITGGTTPVICVLVVNNHCNFNCKYCFGDYANRKTRDYTTEELKTLIDELYVLGVRYLNIHGGETLLRNDIGEIVQHIKSKGMYCCLITNGSLLEKRIDEIRGVDNITISLDGNREHNDLNRGKGTYDITLNAIKLALQKKIPLRVSATITKHTMNDIGHMANLAREMGFTVHFSILFKPLAQAKDCAITDEEIRCAVNQIIEYKKKGFPVFTSYAAARYARDWPLDHNEYHFLREQNYIDKVPKSFKMIKCFYGRIKFTIEADGNVYPCFLQVGHFKPLNWREVGIKKAIEHVQKTNDCVTCPAMTQNDHNLLMGLNIPQISRLLIDQIKESFRRE